MSEKDNSKAIKIGLMIAKEKIHNLLIKKLSKYGEFLLEDAQFRAEYQSFTGNTITSLAFGVYERGSLTDVVFISGLEPAIHAKVKLGQVLFLKHPYEGEPRAVSGKVDISNEWGIDTSLNTLKSLCPKGGNGIVVTTGTEYSVYLERVYDSNVLSDTALYVKNNALSDMKKWINLNTPIDRL